VNNALDTVLVTLAFSAWTTPLANVWSGYSNTGISFHKVPRSASHLGAGDPMRIFLRYGLVSHERIGEYEY
jgi:hypothetical protein